MKRSELQQIIREELAKASSKRTINEEIDGSDALDYTISELSKLNRNIDKVWKLVEKKYDHDTMQWVQSRLSNYDSVADMFILGKMK